MSCVEVNDIFDQLFDENKRLINELLFAKKCLKILLEFKTFVDFISIKFKTILESNETKKFEKLSEKVDEEIKRAKRFQRRPEFTENVDQSGESTDEEFDPKDDVNDSDYEVSDNRKIFKTSHNDEELDVQSGRRISTVMQKKPNSNDGPFVCTVANCGLTFDEEITRDQHMNRVHSNAGIPCSHFGCDRVFKEVRYMKSHVIRMHKGGGPKVRCDWNGCPYVGNKGCVSMHRLRHKRDPNFVFDPRRLRKKRNENLDTTNSEDIVLDANSNDFYSDVSAVTNSEIVNTSQDLNQIVVKADIDEDLQEMSDYGRNEKLENPEPIHVQSTPRIRRLQKHQSSRDRPFICTFEDCRMRFTNRSTLKQHLNRVHTETDIACTHEGCDKVFKTELYMKMHLYRIHMGGGPQMSCDWPECQYVGTKTNLSLHQLKHKRNPDWKYQEKHDRFRKRRLMNEVGENVTEKNKISNQCVNEKQNSKLRIYKLSAERPFACTVAHCGLTFPVKGTLAQHMKRVHSKANIQCVHFGCDRVFKTVYYMKMHFIRIHKGGGPKVKCDWNGCPYVGDKASVSMHRLRHKRYPDFVFDPRRLRKKRNENSDTTNAEDIALNTNSSHNFNDNFDSNCSEDIDLNTNSNQFRRKHYPTESNWIHRPFACTVEGCGVRFSSKYPLHAHMKRVHTEPHIPCTVEGCDKLFKTMNYMEMHRYRVHEGGGPRLACDWPDCDYTGPKHNLRGHILREHPEHPTNQQNIREKKMRMEQERLSRFPCDWPGCEHIANTRQRYHNHALTHKEPQLQCHWPGCDKVFVWKQMLREHMNAVHKNVKPLSCPRDGCEFRTAYRSHLVKHLSVHESLATGIKRWSCSWPGCTYTTHYSSSLKRHTMMHTNEKPFGCDQPGCKFRSSTPKALREHMETHSTLRKYDCKKCGKAFKTNKNLGQHQKFHCH